MALTAVPTFSDHRRVVRQGLMLNTDAVLVSSRVVHTEEIFGSMSYVIDGIFIVSRDTCNIET